MGEAVANSAIELSILTLPLAAGVAILRYRLYEIDLVINRTLVYGALTAGLGGIYAAVSLGLGVAIGSGSTLPTAAATLAVALLFRPLRANIQAAVDKRFDRARYEGLRKVEHFLGELRAGRAAPEETGRVLADALGDPGLEVLFWLPAEEVHVDATGRAVRERAGAGRMRTPVRRGDCSSPLSSTTRRSAGGRTCSRASSLPPGSRSRSAGCAPRCGAGWPRSRTRGPGS